MNVFIKSIDEINYYGTTIGLIISLITMVNTFRLKEKVRSKVDLAYLNIELDIIKDKLNYYLEYASSSKQLEGQELSNARTFFFTLKNKYPLVKPEIIDHINICSSFCWKSTDITPTDFQSFANSLSFIKEELPKEIF